MRNFWSDQNGFTWIELVIIVALIGILSALAWPRIQLMREAAREAATKANIEAIKSAISIYYGDHEGIWPDTLDVSDRTPGYGFGNYRTLPIQARARPATKSPINPFRTSPP